MITKLSALLSDRCTSVKVNAKSGSGFFIPEKQLKFCEAVNISFQSPVQINQKNLGCPGARRSLGFDNDDQVLAEIISENTGIPENHVLQTLSSIPIFKPQIKHINLTAKENTISELPDAFILYVHPSKITFLMQLFAKHNIQVTIPPYSLLSICGNVFANCILNNTVSISFGCPESRQHGGVNTNEVIVGIPCDLARILTKNVP